MDPSDYKTLFEMRNVGHKLVKIRWQDEKQEMEVLLEPGEHTTLKVNGSFQTYPEIKAFNYGCEDTV